MVLWPDLRGDLWRKDVYDSQNIASQSVAVPRKYTAVAYPAVLNQDAHLTYRHGRAGRHHAASSTAGGSTTFSAGSYIDFLHSFDGGATWIRSYRLTDVSKPYDVIHYETVTDVPAGVRTVLFKFLMHNTNPTRGARERPLLAADGSATTSRSRDAPSPLDVTLRWNEDPGRPDDRRPKPPPARRRVPVQVCRQRRRQRPSGHGVDHR